MGNGRSSHSEGLLTPSTHNMTLSALWNIFLNAGTSKHFIQSLLVVKSCQVELVSMCTQFKSMSSVFYHLMNIKPFQPFANDYSNFDFKNTRLS